VLIKSFLFAWLLVIFTCNVLGKGGTNGVVFVAASRGDVAQLQTLFAANTNLLSLRDDLLRTGVMNGQQSTMKFLIARGANVNSKGFFDLTPLADLAMYGRLNDETSAAVAKFLIAHGAQVDPVDQYGGTPLLHAADARKVQLVRVLLEHGANPASSYQRNGHTLLQIAVMNMDLDMIKLLLDFKAPIVGNADNGQTSLLMWTIQRQRYDVTRLLLEHGAVITSPKTIPDMQRNFSPEYPIQNVPNYWPLANANRGTPLLWAVHLHDANLLALLVEFKPPLNAVDQDGRTPLHYAVELGDSNMVKLLIGAGAQPNIVDYHGATPLFIAEAAGNKTMADLLRQLAPTVLTGIPVTITSNETMQSISQRICDGDATAFDELTNQMGVLYSTNRPSEAIRKLEGERLHDAMTILGTEAGKGNLNAMLALQKLLGDKRLKYSSLNALGIAAAAGNTVALDLLLHAHERYDVLQNSICFALEPAVKTNQPAAVDYFVTLSADPNAARNHFYGVGWEIKRMLETAKMNGNAHAGAALDKFLLVFNH